MTSDPPGGQIVGAASDGVFGAVVGSQTTNLRVANVIVDGNGSGIRTQNGTVSAIDCVVTNNAGGAGFGVVASTDSRARVIRSTVTGNGSTGVGATRVTVIDSDVSGNTGTGVSGDRFTIKGSMVNGNGEEGIDTVDGGKLVDSVVNGNGASGLRGGATRLRVVRSDVVANGESGIFLFSGSRVTIKESSVTDNAADGVHNDTGWGTRVVNNSVITGNGFHGIASSGTFTGECRQIVRDSTVTGNGTDPDCGVTVTCADLAACEPPSIAGVTCDTSYDTLSGFPGTSWGICALD